MLFDLMSVGLHFSVCLRFDVGNSNKNEARHMYFCYVSDF